MSNLARWCWRGSRVQRRKACRSPLGSRSGRRTKTRKSDLKTNRKKYRSTIHGSTDECKNSTDVAVHAIANCRRLRPVVPPGGPPSTYPACRPCTRTPPSGLARRCRCRLDNRTPWESAFRSDRSTPSGRSPWWSILHLQGRPFTNTRPGTCTLLHSAYTLIPIMWITATQQEGC